jgi:hypothetical protein
MPDEIQIIPADYFVEGVLRGANGGMVGKREVSARIDAIDDISRILDYSTVFLLTCFKSSAGFVMLVLEDFQIHILTAERSQFFKKIIF